MIHRLLRGQPGDRRQHAEGIGGQQNHVRRRWPQVLFAGVGNELDRVGAAGILGLAVVGEVEHAGVGIHGDVFQDRAEHLRGCVDLRLALGRKVDHLGVAATFEVEDRLIRPPVLVIADKRAAGVSRQRGLAGTREAEEDCALAVRSDIGRTMHRHHALRRQEEVQQAENALLHFA